MFTIGQLYSTEMYGAIAVAAVYAWLLVNSTRISLRAVWFIPPFLIILCAIHCLMLTLRLSMIGGYLKTIEDVLATDSKIVGWEHYKLSHGWVDTSDCILATVGWVSGLIASVAISWWGATRRLPDIVRNAPH